MFTVSILSQANKRHITLPVGINGTYLAVYCLTNLTKKKNNEWLRKLSRILKFGFFFKLFFRAQQHIHWAYILIRKLTIRKDYHMNHRKMRLEAISFHCYADYVAKGRNINI